MEGLVDLLGNDPRLVPDIHFRVIEEVLVNGILETKTELVGAHKFVLAMLSDVFKSLFFGPMRDENEEIDITGTTIEAFKEFLKILYSLHTSSCETSIVEVKPLFEILSLSKRYIVQPAVAIIEERIMSIKFPNSEPESIIPAAVIAVDHKELVGFETISEKFLQSCSGFLNESLTTVHQVRQFLVRVETFHSPEKLALVVRLLALTDCSNCKAPKCLNGEMVTRENIASNAKVRALCLHGNAATRKNIVKHCKGEGIYFRLNDEDKEKLVRAEMVGKIDASYNEKGHLGFPNIYIDVDDEFDYGGDVFTLDEDLIYFECNGQ